MNRVFRATKGMKMKKGYRVASAPLLFALLSACIVISLSNATYAQKRSRTQSKKTKSSQTKSKQTKSKKVVPVANQPQPIQVKNGAVAKAPVMSNKASRLARASRSRAIQLARLRAAQARSAALANVAAAN